jgi:hypothetical protein
MGRREREREKRKRGEGKGTWEICRRLGDPSRLKKKKDQGLEKGREENKKKINGGKRGKKRGEKRGKKREGGEEFWEKKGENFLICLGINYWEWANFTFFPFKRPFKRVPSLQSGEIFPLLLEEFPFLGELPPRRLWDFSQAW